MTTTTYEVGSIVTYKHELPVPAHILEYGCGQVVHHGTVTAVEDDAAGDQVVTVEFDCGLTQDILSSELAPAELAE